MVCLSFVLITLAGDTSDFIVHILRGTTYTVYSFVYSVISLLNMLTPGMRPVCASVCLCVCVCVYQSVTAFCSRILGPILMNLFSNNLI